jgi:hypothetical protein
MPPPGHLDASRGRHFIRAPRNVAGGLLLVGLAALALWLSAYLDQGTLREMGPGMLPRWLACGVGACGIILTASGIIREGDGLAGTSLRGPALVVLAILAFAATIRPFNLAGLTMPGLGLVVAGPLAILIGGFATPEARLKELVVLALGLTPFCMVLFGDLLNLPIPIFPRALAELFPPDWSQKLILRTTAAALFAAAALVFLAERHLARRPAAIRSRPGVKDE